MGGTKLRRTAHSKGQKNTTVWEVATSEIQRETQNPMAAMLSQLYVQNPMVEKADSVKPPAESNTDAKNGKALFPSAGRTAGDEPPIAPTQTSNKAEEHTTTRQPSSMSGSNSIVPDASSKMFAWWTSRGQKNSVSTPEFVTKVARSDDGCDVEFTSPTSHQKEDEHKQQDMLERLYFRHGTVDSAYHDKHNWKALWNHFSWPCFWGMNILALGGEHDGSTRICGFHRYRFSPCVVYSFGSGKDLRFEASMHELNPECEIHIFNTERRAATVEQTEKDPRFTYHEGGLGMSMGNLHAVGSAGTLSSVAQSLGHQGIDVLRISVRSSEYGIMNEWANQGNLPSVAQILLEVQDVSQNDVVGVLRTLYTLDFRLVHVEYIGGDRAELVLVQRTFVPAAVRYPMKERSRMPCRVDRDVDNRQLAATSFATILRNMDAVEKQRTQTTQTLNTPDVILQIRASFPCRWTEERAGTRPVCGLRELASYAAECHVFAVNNVWIGPDFRRGVLSINPRCNVTVVQLRTPPLFRSDGRCGGYLSPDGSGPAQCPGENPCCAVGGSWCGSSPAHCSGTNFDKIRAQRPLHSPSLAGDGKIVWVDKPTTPRLRKVDILQASGHSVESAVQWLEQGGVASQVIIDLIPGEAVQLINRLENIGYRIFRKTSLMQDQTGPVIEAAFVIRSFDPKRDIHSEPRARNPKVFDGSDNRATPVAAGIFATKVLQTANTCKVDILPLHSLELVTEATQQKILDKQYFCEGELIARWKTQWKPVWIACSWPCFWGMNVLGIVGQTDGNKWICGFHRYRSRSCVVYSFGSRGDITFEASVHEVNPECEIHTFDPTVPAQEADMANKDRRIKFHSKGLGGFRGNLPGVGPVDTLGGIAESLGHTRIDLLKIDVESSEYQTILEWAKGHNLPSVAQILIEVHEIPPSDIRGLMLTLYLLDFNLVHIEYNGDKCAELVFVQRTFVPAPVHYPMKRAMDTSSLKGPCNVDRGVDTGQRAATSYPKMLKHAEWADKQRQQGFTLMNKQAQRVPDALLEIRANFPCRWTEEFASIRPVCGLRELASHVPQCHVFSANSDYTGVNLRRGILSINPTCKIVVVLVGIPPNQHTSLTKDGAVQNVEQPIAPDAKKLDILQASGPSVATAVQWLERGGMASQVVFDLAPHEAVSYAKRLENLGFRIYRKTYMEQQAVGPAIEIAMLQRKFDPRIDIHSSS